MDVGIPVKNPSTCSSGEEKKKVKTAKATVKHQNKMIGEISKEKEEITKEKEEVARERDAMQQKARQLEEELKQMKAEKKQLEESAGRDDVENQELRDENRRLQDMVQATSQQTCEQEEMIEELKNRLSEQISQGCAKDANLEAVSSKNRPLAIRDRYEEICSDEWLSAKDFLDDQDDSIYEPSNDLPEHVWDRIKCELLCTVFEVGWKRCEEVKQNMMSAISSPLGAWAHEQTDVKELQQESLDDDVRMPVMEFHINETFSSDTKNMDKLVKVVLLGIKIRCRDKMNSWLDLNINTSDSVNKLINLFTMHKLDEPIEEFVVAVCKLCWTMVIQHVPMTFDTSGTDHEFSGSTQRPHYTCEQKGKVIAYIYPAMYHGDKLLHQGMVLTQQIREHIPAPQHTKRRIPPRDKTNWITSEPTSKQDVCTSVRDGDTPTLDNVQFHSSDEGEKSVLEQQICAAEQHGEYQGMQGTTDHQSISDNNNMSNTIKPDQTDIGDTRL